MVFFILGTSVVLVSAMCSFSLDLVQMSTESCLYSSKGLQEVIRDMAADVRLATTRSWVKLEEGVFQMLVNLHDGSLITTSIAVVWRTENCHHISVLTPVIALWIKPCKRKADNCQRPTAIDNIVGYLTAIQPTSMTS